MIPRLFSFYGSKSSVIATYPKPKHDVIIEPFAGSASYASAYHDRQVVLCDADKVIADLWKWLTTCSYDEVMALPATVEPDGSNLLGLHQEARSLIGFWCNHATPQPRLVPSSWMRSGIRPNSFWGPVVRQVVANQLHKIRHWKVIWGSYQCLENVEGTWFVDPPYQGKPGRAYSCQVDNYYRLALWCRERRGQVIVCEQEGADWLPFKPHVKIRTHSSYAKKASSSEVIWTNG
jgi:hypothetical protein